MIKWLRTLAVLAGLVPAVAVAQPVLTNLPPNTVVGRLGTSSGPAQAIPFATLNTNMLNSLCTTAGAFPIYNATSGLWVCSTAGGTGSQSALNGPASVVTSTFISPPTIPGEELLSSLPQVASQMIATYAGAANPSLFGTISLLIYRPTTASNGGNVGLFGDIWYDSTQTESGSIGAIRGDAYVISQLTATIATGGSNNVVGDLLTIQGGSCGNFTTLRPIFRVDVVSGGAVTAASLYNKYLASCDSYPSNPVTTTSSRGGATPPTLNITNAAAPSVNFAYGVYGRPKNQSGGALTWMASFYADGSINASTGSATNTASLYAVPPMTVTNPPTNSYGVWFAGAFPQGSLAALSGSNMTFGVAGAVFYFSNTLSTAPTPPNNALMTISSNVGNIPALPLSGNVLALAALDNSATRLNLLAASSTGAAAPIANFYHSRGTIASPGATQSGDTTFALVGTGYGTSYQTNGGIGFIGVATENFDGTHGGSKLQLFATANATVTRTVVAEFFFSSGASVINTPGSFNFQNGGTQLGYTANTSQWYFGQAAVAPPSNVLATFSTNTGAISGLLSNNVAVFANADGAQTRLALISANTSGGVFPALNFYTSRGTVAAPSATQNTDFLFVLGAAGYGTSFQTGGGSGLIGNATENFDGTHGGSNLQIFGTAGGSVTKTIVATYQVGVQVGSPTGGDPGAGIINLATGLRINGAATSGHYLRGNGTNYIDGTIANGDLPGSGGITVAIGTNVGIAASGCATVVLGGTCTLGATTDTVRFTSLGLGGAAQATGIFVYNAYVTVGSNGIASIGAGTTTGGLYGGKGSTSDFSLLNSGGSVVCSNPTGTTTFTCAGTLIASPIAGGTGSSSSLTLESTTGSGTTDSIIFRTASQTSAGFIDTSQRWLLGNNTAATPFANLSSATVAAVANADGNLTRFAIVSASTVPAPILNMYSSRGTVASPTATQSGDSIGAFGGAGWGTAYQTNGGWIIKGIATETLDGTHGGTKMQLNATPNGSSLTTLVYMELGGASTINLFNIGTGAGGGALCGTNNMTGATGGPITYQNAAACTVSLRAFKERIEPLQPAGQYPSILEEVMALKIDQFYFRHGYVDNGARQRVGLIADEVELVDPRMATYDGKGQLSGVDYVYSLAIAFKAIQELKADNDNLRSDLAQLKRAVR